MSILSNFNVFSQIFIIGTTKFAWIVMLFFWTELMADIFFFDTF